MAPPVYSLRIFAHASLDASAGIVGPTVPDGLIYVVRDIDVAEETTLATAEMQVINQVGGSLFVASVSATGTHFPFQWRGRQVYAEGERVAVQVFSGTWGVAISGYQLTLP